MRTDNLAPGQIKGRATALQKKGEDFIAAYEKLCNQFMMFVDSSIGSSEVSTADSKSEIKDHCQNLRKVLQSDIGLNLKLLETKGWRTPKMQIGEGG